MRETESTRSKCRKIASIILLVAVAALQGCGLESATEKNFRASRHENSPKSLQQDLQLTSTYTRYYDAVFQRNLEHARAQADGRQVWILTSFLGYYQERGRGRQYMKENPRAHGDFASYCPYRNAPGSCSQFIFITAKHFIKYDFPKQKVNFFFFKEGPGQIYTGLPNGVTVMKMFGNPGADLKLNDFRTEREKRWIRKNMKIGFRNTRVFNTRQVSTLRVGKPKTLAVHIKDTGSLIIQIKKNIESLSDGIEIIDSDCWLLNARSETYKYCTISLKITATEAHLEAGKFLGKIAVNHQSSDVKGKTILKLASSRILP